MAEEPKVEELQKVPVVQAQESASHVCVLTKQLSE